MDMSAEQSKRAQQIAALLRKAESTTHDAEREAFMDGAYRLMAKFAIDDAMLAAVNGSPKEDTIVKRFLKMTGIYQKAQMRMAASVAQSFGLRVYYTEGDTWDEGKNGKRKRSHYHTLYFVGFESDVDRFDMTYASLDIQCVAALSAFLKEQKAAGHPGWNRYVAARSFIEGFGHRVAERVKDSRRIAVAESADTNHAALALRDRADQVDDWMKSNVGGLRAGRRSREQTSDAGRSAGRQAGERADIGQTRLGNRKALKS